jgi:hypothetical protein
MIAVDGFPAVDGRDSGAIALSVDQPPLPPAPPVLSLGGTRPASPANDNRPHVTGTAPDGAEVRLYRNDPTCTGAPAATGSAAELAGAGIEVQVPDDSTTAIRATAAVADRVSACAAPVDYVEDSTAPPTPTLLRAVPPNGNWPLAVGRAEAGASVRLYVDDATCSGPPASTGSAAEFGDPGIALVIARSAKIRATAVDAGGASGCSPALIYAAQKVSCGGRPATLVGTARADLIRGTARRDVIAGLGGDDELRGLKGDDILCGGPGADLLLGGRGQDELHGGPGADTARQERTR